MNSWKKQNPLYDKVRVASSTDFFKSATECNVMLATSSHVPLKLDSMRMQLLYYLLENSLKGHLIALKGNTENAVKETIKIKHDIVELISECRKIDSAFLNWLDLLPKNALHKQDGKLSKTELSNKYQYIILYTLIAKQQDLKYGVTDIKGYKYKALHSTSKCQYVTKIVKEIVSHNNEFKEQLEWFINYGGLKKYEKDYLESFIP